MELSDYIRVLRKNWLVIVLATILGLGAAAGYSFTRTPMYEASSTVFVSTQAGGTVQELQQGSSFTQSRMTTYANLVTTPVVMNPVIAELGLDASAALLAQAVTATNATNTQLITITVSDADPVRAADIANALGASLTETVERLETPTGSPTSPVRLSRVRDALPPHVPASPNIPLNLALGGLVGLALGVGAAVLRSVLDTRIRTPRDVELVTDTPIIGAIAFDPKAKDRPLIVHEDPASPRAETFRALRTNLQFLDMGGRASFVITSSPAERGQVDLDDQPRDRAGRRRQTRRADRRRSAQAEGRGIPRHRGRRGTHRCADRPRTGGRRHAALGPAQPLRPSRRTHSPEPQRAARLAARCTPFSTSLEKEFDVVLCDAPPLLPVTDAAILAKATSGALVVVASGRTNRHQLSGALDALSTVGAKVAGVVLSMVPTRGPIRTDYGYGHGYGYGYGYGHAVERGDPATARRVRRRTLPRPKTSQRNEANLGELRSDECAL